MNPFVRKQTQANRKHRTMSAKTRTKRSRAFLWAERLEDRCLLAASLDISALGVLTYLGSAVNNNTSISDSSTSGSGNYTINDTGETITLSAAAIALGWTGSTTHTVTGPDSSVNSMSVDVDGGNNVVNILSTTDPISVTGSGAPDQTNIGNAGSLAGIVANITVQDTGVNSSLSVDDSAPTTAESIQFTDNTISGALPGGNTISYNPGITDLTFSAGSGGNTVSVNMPTINDTATLNLNTGSGNDNVTVTAVNAGLTLNIHGQAGTDSVTLGGSTVVPLGMQGLNGTINVDNAAGSTALTLDDSQDTASQTASLTDNGTTGTVTGLSPATINYTDADISSLTVNGGSGGNTFTVNGTLVNPSFPSTLTTLNTGISNDVVQVSATGASTLDIQGQAGTDTVTLGGSTSAPLGMQGLNGTISVDNTAGSTALTLDDSQDTTGQTALLTDGAVTGLSPAVINYTDAGISSLTVNGGSGANTFTVDGTLVNPSFPSTLTTLNKGTGTGNEVDVTATNAGSKLAIHGQGGIGSTDAVTIHSAATVKGIVTVDELNGGLTALTIDLSTDGLAHDFNLTSDGTTSTLHDTLGNLPQDITYVTADLSSLTIDTSPAAAEVLNVDFSGGNPIPTGSATGLIFNAGADFGNAFSHALNLLGTLPSGPFATEIHNANDHGVFPQIGQYGSIFFTDADAVATGLDYTGLLPINDTAGAVNYTFNDFADDQSFTAQNGPTVLGFNTIQFVNTPAVPPPTFETTNVANKTNIVFNTTTTTAGVNGIVNITTPSTLLSTLTFNTPTDQDNTVSFVNTPPGVATFLNGGADEDVTNVTGKGVPAGTTLTVNGGGSAFGNTLNYNAGGLTPTITAGGSPGEVLITIPGFGTVDALDYSQINITNVAPIVITPGSAVSINSVEGFQLVNQIVGTFTAPIGIAGAPAGFPASDFTASIDWGDPSVDRSAGTITQDASNPSVYYITGTHTFVENGTYTVANTVAFAGGTSTVTVTAGGVPVPVTFTFGPSGPTAGTSATATVTQGPLAVTAFPIVGTEGIAIAAGPIATFIDAGGADPLAAYSATITVTNSAGVVVATPVASIAPDTDTTSPEWTVSAAAFTLTEEGTYQVLVKVTDSDALPSITVSGASTAVIADAALAAGAPVALAPAPNTGVALPAATVVGTFTDANLTAPIGDFTATIDWGDGSPNSIGTITQPGGVGTAFDVTGGHIYATMGTYTTTIVVKDVGGSTVTLTGSATVTDLAVTGSTKNFTAVEGQDTGLFMEFRGHHT